MNHRGTEHTELFTEDFLGLAQTRLMKHEIIEVSERPFKKLSVSLCALCDSVVD